jgi:hypothetical protein
MQPRWTLVSEVTVNVDKMDEEILAKSDEF